MTQTTEPPKNPGRFNRALQRDLDTQRNECVASVSALEERLRKAQVHASEATSIRDSHRSELAASFVAHAELEELQSLASNWRKRRSDLDATESSLKELATAQSAIDEHQSAIAEALIEHRSREGGLSRDVTLRSREMASVRQLLQQLANHVQNGVCLLCGHDHKSLESLRTRIAARIQFDGLGAAQGELDALRSRILELLSQQSELQNKRSDLDVQIVRLQILTTQSKSWLEDAEVKLLAAGILIDTNTGALTQIRSRLERAAVDLDRLRQLSSTSTLTATNAQSTCRILEDELRTGSASLASLEEQLTAVTNRVIRKRFEADSLGLPTTDGNYQIDDAKAKLAGALSAARTEAAGAQEEVDSLTSSSSVIGGLVTTGVEKVSALTRELGGVKAQIAMIHSQFEADGLEPNSSEVALTQVVERQNEVSRRCTESLEIAAALEAGLDAATTAAVLSGLQQSVSLRELELASLERSLAASNPWLSYFETVLDLVLNQRGEAVADFIAGFGPRTTTLQRRLRSVYGFDDLEISDNDGAIRVNVSRRGKQLRPVDYFSQSQQQTLLLGLFLTTCISQTWSSLATVLLDDPVSHFDDLNTYAFLDLVAGLCTPENESRQFVISTCDERLLDLARQKFQHLGHSARFYKFTATTSDGPEIEEIANSDLDPTGETPQ